MHFLIFKLFDFMQRWLCYFLLLISSLSLFAQDCKISLSGTVSEKSVALPMDNVYAVIQETKQTAISDKNGNFNFTNLCEGSYHIKFSHIGCETLVEFVALTKDKKIEIQLEHHTELLNETVLHGEQLKSTQQSNTLNNEVITENANKSFGELLSQIQGVSSIKSGNSISKPVIHGLTNNRVGFITNGVTLSSQQWGNDHAPEIDAFTADHISVVKGVSTLEYTTTASNALVIIDPIEIGKEPHLHGAANYIFDTNGRGHTGNVRLTNYNKIVGFALVGTYKKFGDAKAPNYYLTNTGGEQKNASLQFNKELSNKLKIDGMYTFFETELGTLAGAFADSEEALFNSFSNEVPDRTSDSFSYEINPPRQEVTHHLAKLGANYKFSNFSKLKFQFAFQNNLRQEYDNRRAGRSTRPVLDLDKKAYSLESVYELKTNAEDVFKAGVQLTQTKNRNIPGTGVDHLIPDFNLDEIGFFTTYISKFNQLTFETGARVSARAFSGAASRDGSVESFENQFTTPSLAAGLSYKFSEKVNSSLNIGVTSRAPIENELYSFGLHQGVAAWEIGDENLHAEKSLKITWATQFNINNKFFIESLLYYNPYLDYIFLEPLGTARVTVAGTFNNFIYSQTDALLYGADLRVVYEPTENFIIVLKGAYLRGQDVSEDIPLINMSPNNGSLDFSYLIKNTKLFKNNKLGFNVSHTAKQNRFSIEKEIVEPPEAYTLIGFSGSTQLNVKNQKIDVGFSIENATNTSYRSYLNRLRYFADEQGINVSFRMAYKF